MFLSILSQLSGLEGVTHQDIIAKRRELRNLILKVGVEELYGKGPVTFDTAIAGKTSLGSIEEIENFLKSPLWFSYNLTFKEYRCVATIFNCSILVHHITQDVDYGMTVFYRFPRSNPKGGKVEGAKVTEIIYIRGISRPIFRIRGLARKLARFWKLDWPIMHTDNWESLVEH